MQYAELGELTEGTQNTYQQAFQCLDGDGPQHITSNTIDEIGDATFLNLYLELMGADPQTPCRAVIRPAVDQVGVPARL